MEQIYCKCFIPADHYLKKIIIS